MTSPYQHPNPDWAAVVLYYRRGEEIWETIDSIVSQDPPPKDVVIVDNASHDGTLNAENVRAHGARLIQLSENKGYAGGMNCGVAALGDASWVLLATHDILLPSGAATSALSAVAAVPSTVAVGPILEVDNSTWSAGGTIGMRGPRHTTKVPDRPIEAQWLDGCCIFVRTWALREVSGIDERYFLYWEDVDLGHRLSKLGALVVTPEVRVIQETARTPVYFGARNAIVYWRARRSYIAAAAATVLSLAKVIVRDHSRREAAVARLSGVRDGWTGRLNVPQSLIREH
ncbi:glycosyltransferase family 2 protein [Nesterenkonia jeotgali]|uniref:N-acetylglucosaminyl-diphospho-decaprenol L-rhamnosyltransferase n=1 Tax=Nesterenkonia jeotgali TaxID=317018 RepID=A0A839FNF1_9MICC|nr:glycosyltransferase family 2 protein [Nesterenkonia jeotgali]MBA8921009.1 N-acetylglucosaminyl-diphospho-decaprenol L-rhamnosyltransferase [Nesterenkonia jeotgali]